MQELSTPDVSDAVYCVHCQLTHLIKQKINLMSGLESQSPSFSGFTQSCDSHMYKAPQRLIEMVILFTPLAVYCYHNKHAINLSVEQDLRLRGVSSPVTDMTGVLLPASTVGDGEHRLLGLAVSTIKCYTSDTMAQQQNTCQLFVKICTTLNGITSWLSSHDAFPLLLHRYPAPPFAITSKSSAL